MRTRSWFWDRMAKRYARMPLADQAAYDTKLEMTRAVFPPRARVLEFGCGTGSTAILHAPHVAHIHAIDFSASMLGIARTRAAQAGVANLSFEQSTLEALDSPDGSWDVVMGMSILHLLPDRAAALRRVHALLKPGGAFVSSTICIGDGPSKFRFIAPLFKWLPILPDVAVLTLAQLTAEMTAAGFTVETTWRPAPHKAAFVVARKPVADPDEVPGTSGYSDGKSLPEDAHER